MLGDIDSLLKNEVYFTINNEGFIESFEDKG